MCGIVGCILKNDKAAPVLMDCLQRLEYRGYDSVGLATYSSSGINIRKDRGKIKEVSQELHLEELPGKIGIGHVRWATHGLPTQENAHPHTDCEGKITVVHNGIIENYKELKDQLVSEGHNFVSQTDTEVIAHLIEKYHKEGLDLEEAMNKAISKLQGSYAFAVISTDEPNRILGVRKESPLILGLGDGEYFLASDAPALLQHTRKIIYLADHETFIMDENGITVKDRDGQILDKPVETIRWTPEMAQKGGYPHFMLKEIHEQPEAVRNTLFEVSDIKDIVSQFPEFKRIAFVACGTSYHASLVGKYLFEGLLGLPTDVMLASEFEFYENAIDSQTLVIFISQSGETADTLKALRTANKKAKTLAIVNVLGSTATREADYVIFTRAGPEIGVAATKTYLSQLTCIYLLAASMCHDEELLEELQKIPDCMNEVLSLEDRIKEMAGKYKDASDFFFIGRGFSYPTAMEGALKLKEITYIHGEGYAAGELKHGPLALIDDDVPVVAVVPPGKSHDRTLSNVQEVKARGARVIGLGSEDDQVLSSESSDMIEFPHQIQELISPLLYVVPLQLLSYYISVQRGIDPDKPKNLAKCVTVE
ncbi:glutamine--fructose-6-phosphate transaminase (isomerizing) [uncultured Methanobacterium sp.]|uniref:glutamine--fructose-6-phosphate transaminase (isomerizing) n=1 Tax=uncultured Methanobacterium sp. TaxID=176306 RepID=UPI0028059BF3|nr:glutamine--fructose-6-phosphate transaminase (isomerizing) [uncultured Methanobacterium sp.]